MKRREVYLYRAMICLSVFAVFLFMRTGYAIGGLSALFGLWAIEKGPNP